jgi:hypothetical protein
MPGIVSAVAWALYDCASQAVPRGSVNAFDRDTYSAFSGFDEATVDAVINALTDKGVIKDGVLSGWEKYQPKREDGSADRSKEWRERNRTQPNADEHREDKKEDKIREESKTPRASALDGDDWPKGFEDLFWDCVPVRKEKQKALKALYRVRKQGVSWFAVIEGMKNYAHHCRGKDAQYIKHPATWLNAGCWDDDLSGKVVAIVPEKTATQTLVNQMDDRWDILAAGYRKAKGKAPPVNREGGWYFENSWVEKATEMLEAERAERRINQTA